MTDKQWDKLWKKAVNAAVARDYDKLFILCGKMEDEIMKSWTPPDDDFRGKCTMKWEDAIKE